MRASPRKTIETIDSNSLWINLLILGLLSFTLRIIDISHLPIDDELFNVIAAHSWAEEGSFKMLDGVYQRAYLFSMSVGYLFRLFGENLVIARIPALVAGIMWILLVFIWVRKYSGPTAAWITALLFCFAPHAIELSQLCRFYTLHGLLFWIGATSIFISLTSNTRLIRKLIFCLVAFVCFSLALHLQITTLIGLAGLAIWAFFYLTFSLITQSQGLQRRRIIQFVCILLIIFIAMAIINVDFITGVYTKLHTQAFWHKEEGYLFYHKLFYQQYQILWSLLPCAILIVILRVPQIGFYLTTVFLFSFIIHSIAGWKEERYIFYMIPFLFSIWGIAIKEILPALCNFYEKCKNKLTFLHREGHLGNIIKWSIVTVGFVLLLFANGATKRTINKILGQSYYYGLSQSDWVSAKEQLKKLSEGTSVILTTNIPKSIYYLGGFDYAINKNNLAENHQSMDFSIDPRSGRPLFGTAKSLKKIINCYPEGLFVGEKKEWGFGTRIDSESAELLEKYAERIFLPEQWNIITFKWKNHQLTSTKECLELPGYERIHPNVVKVEDAADPRRQ